MIKIFLFFVSVLWATSLSAHPLQKQKEQKGEKQMATLLWAEDFDGFQGTGNERLSPLSSRGWNTSTSPGNPFYFERDRELNKVVTYIRWTNGNRGMPDNASNDGTIYKRIPNEVMNNGVTVHFTAKYHNFIYNGNGNDCHGGIYLNPRTAEGNTVGEITIDPLRRGKGNVYMPNNRAGDPDRTFTIMNNGRGYSYRYLIQQNMTHSFLEDDVWYDVVVYIRTNNGGSNQRWALWAKEHSASTYHKHMDYTGSVQNVPSSNPIVMLAGYFHRNSSRSEVRMYTGFVHVYSGDAMADGLIGGENGGGTDPVDPPVNPTPDELTISDHETQTSSDTAVLSWKTNKPANAVVDYGDTDARGTITRDDELKEDHRIELSGLQPETTYYYRFSSRDADGEVVMDPENSTFATEKVGGTDPGEPPTEPTEIALNDIVDVNVDNAKKGDALVFDGSNWVSVDLNTFVEAKVVEVLDRTKIVVS